MGKARVPGGPGGERLDAGIVGQAGEGGPVALPVSSDLPERFGYRVKRLLLGRPLITAALHRERLSRPLALGVLAPDCISSSAYGTEEMLIELLPFFGLAAFTLVLPITGVILVILVLLTLSYREIVQVYTKAGGSYVVARENFGPRVAQVAAVALLIDYVVTVAVQTAAGTVAVVSAVPALGPYSLEITIGVIVVLAYGNLRGIREAGRVFAAPTYLFATAIGAVIVTGVVRNLLGTLPRYEVGALSGTVPVHHYGPQVSTAVVVLALLRSFANGGSSLTGLEAISNGVSAFRPREGVNARKVMVAMSCTLGFLVAGVSWLAYRTHAIPYASGYPSVISQEARIVFGHSAAGHALFLLVQTCSALILYTGANTSFNGFPFLASFVAEDSFLPRQLTRRGHRLAFSNGILVLAAVSILLILGTGAKVNALVPLYAIGVFTGFTLAGFGMARYHLRQREPRWRPKLVINTSAAVLSALVVLIFAVVKFTEGAWLVVLIFPIMVVLLIRLNRRYRREEDALATLAPIVDREPNLARHTVLVLVDDLDLAVLRALRYARSLRPDAIHAVHFVIDSAHAEQLAQRWRVHQRGDMVLEMRDCPDRRVARAALELTARLISQGHTEVTVVLPRRTYPGLVGRLLHDRTADRIADVISRVPHAAATIVPFDVAAALGRLAALRAAKADRSAQPSGAARSGGGSPVGGAARAGPGGDSLPAVPAAAVRPRALPALATEEPAEAGTVPIAALRWRQRQTVQARVVSTQVQPVSNSQVLECEIADETGALLVLFYGRNRVAGVEPGRRIRVTGVVGSRGGVTCISNPVYELLPDDQSG